MKTISKLQFITTNATAAELACKGGVDWIQLRLKNVSYEEYRNEALKVQEVCKKYGATLIINDLPKLAMDIKADGVHVGKDDILTQEDIDALLEGGYIIGCTTNTIEDILHFVGKPVNYLGLGPFRFTKTKNNLSPVLGIEGYKKIFSALKQGFADHPPIVAIGGITVADVPELFTTGIHSIAVSGAISNAEDVTVAAQMFKQSVLKEEVISI
jgi:thiamine-phosphate pyrophosphorylase